MVSDEDSISSSTLDSLEFSYENEISGINTAHNSQLEEIAYLDEQEDAAYQANIDALISDTISLNSIINGLNSDIHASAEYRAQIIKVMAKKAVSSC